MITLIGNDSVPCKTIFSIPVSSIASRTGQCRFDFNDAALLSLADSIHRHGILTPLTVSKTADGYEIISGERRLRAALILGMETLPCFVADGNYAELALVENMHRENLNMFEQALLIETLIRDKHLTQEEAAHCLSCSQSAVANKLRLLRFEQDERKLILSGELTERHARALLRIADKRERIRAILEVIDKDLNVSSCESLVEEIIGYRAKQTATDIRETGTLPSCSVRDPGFCYNTLDKVADDFRRFGLMIDTSHFEDGKGVSVTMTLKKKAEA